MSNESKPAGIIVPKFVHHYSDVVGDEARAAPIHLLGDEGEPRSEQDILLEILQQLRRLESSKGNNSRRAYEIEFCTKLVERLLASSESPLSESDPTAALLLGYFYRGLTLPSQEHYQAVTHETLRLLHTEYSRGKNDIKKCQEQGREWIQQKAGELWAKDRDKVRKVNSVAEEVQSLLQEEAERRHRDLGDPMPLLCWSTRLSHIRKIVSGVAPVYAKRPGRPRKSR
ncbi:hypothetical protein [Billgrantia antri]|uniref:hypothetical protein n=1 Tax=Billgrantia antri TaxID=2846777 RepID=UPI003B20FB25